MEITLAHEVDSKRNIYKGEAACIEDKDLCLNMSTIIIATSSEEALLKLKEYVLKQYPSLGTKEVQYLITCDMAVA